MQGDVYVYTGIGGNNISGGIMPLDLSGSSNPGVDAGEQGTDINVYWTLPGGINNQKSSDGQAVWAYVVQDRATDPKYDTDEDVYKWLKGELIGTSYNLSTFFSQEQITAEDPAIVPAVNELVYQYITRLLYPPEGVETSMDEFIRYFKDTGCYVTGRK